MPELGFRIVRDCCPRFLGSNKFLGNEINYLKEHIGNCSEAVKKAFSDIRKENAVYRIERYAVVEIGFIDDNMFLPVVNRCGEALDVRIGVYEKRGAFSDDNIDDNFTRNAIMFMGICRLAKEVCKYFEVHSCSKISARPVHRDVVAVTEDFAGEFDPEVFNSTELLNAVVMVDFEEIAFLG